MNSKTNELLRNIESYQINIDSSLTTSKNYLSDIDNESASIRNATNDIQLLCSDYIPGMSNKLTAMDTNLTTINSELSKITGDYYRFVRAGTNTLDNTSGWNKDFSSGGPYYLEWRNTSGDKVYIDTINIEWYDTTNYTTGTKAGASSTNIDMDCVIWDDTHTSTLTKITDGCTNNRNATREGQYTETTTKLGSSIYHHRLRLDFGESKLPLENDYYIGISMPNSDLSGISDLGTQRLTFGGMNKNGIL